MAAVRKRRVEAMSQSVLSCWLASLCLRVCDRPQTALAGALLHRGAGVHR
jgi:hypothetical protein